jgi:hypothetical protein
MGKSHLLLTSSSDTVFRREDFDETAQNQAFFEGFERYPLEGEGAFKKQKKKMPWSQEDTR